MSHSQRKNDNNNNNNDDDADDNDEDDDDDDDDDDDNDNDNANARVNLARYLFLPWRGAHTIKYLNHFPQNALALYGGARANFQHVWANKYGAPLVLTSLLPSLRSHPYRGNAEVMFTRKCDMAANASQLAASRRHDLLI